MTEFELNNPFNEASKGGMLPDGCGIFERYYTNGQEVDFCGLIISPNDELPPINPTGGSGETYIILGENGVKSKESVDSQGNKIIKLSIQLDANALNKAFVSSNGLFVNNITDCGSF